MKKIICTAFVALAASSLAHAEGMYVGANVSSRTDGNIKYTENGVTTEHSAAKRATPIGLFAGYDLSPVWALEAGYRTDGGSTSFDLSPGYRLKTRVSTAYLAARGTWKLSEDWSLFGKAGVGQGRLKMDISGKNAPAGESVNKTGLYLSAGASYLVTRDVALQLELEHTNKLEHDGFTAKTDRFALGVRFDF
ncbi:porin family protein [Duganella sp. BJB488]|uniref:porin family protein n=1 Tax=unclassified Duganella TaxID=2636909 RepID=UPI000E34F3CF|nr:MULTISPECIES: porin family protein [unclassified Duganella]NVD70395.1 porin family protein [Duganella sp. BJB1802]RFP22718.1 porin family protein [Duganella sp. BJB489]RFP25207.1 porin family protein [Duganella sp. BJB488]RFP33717.1 porin family protein [Duganella sp. BJB480]